MLGWPEAEGDMGGIPTIPGCEIDPPRRRQETQNGKKHSWHKHTPNRHHASKEVAIGPRKGITRHASKRQTRKKMDFPLTLDHPRRRGESR